MKIVIIGNGISGISAARWVRKLSDHEILVISSETEYFYSRTALMYIYMGHMRLVDTQPYEKGFWEKNRIDLLKAHVRKINFEQKSLTLDKGEDIQYDKLLLAVGSKSNKFDWPGQDLSGVGGLYHYQDLQQIETCSKNLNRAVVVGGGLIGIEMAEMFRSRDIPVTMLVRESQYWDNVLPAEEASIVSQHIRDHHIDLRLSSNLKEIIDDGNGKAKGVIIQETEEQVDCGYVGLTAGVRPNVDWLKNSGLELERGILVDNFLQTNIPDVYACGDCAQLKSPRPGRQAIEAVWYTGRMMGETVAYNLCGQSVSYDPGIWFNSAKFLDIEYQVYGDVPRQRTEGKDALFWSEDNQSIRIVYRERDQAVIGFNLLGVRFRQEVCEKWIREEVSLKEVISNINLADFNTEFSSRYAEGLQSIYNNKMNQNIAINKARNSDAVYSFLKN